MKTVVQETLVASEAHFAYIWRQAQEIERIVLFGLARALDKDKECAQLGEMMEELNAYGESPYKRIDIVDLINALDQLVKREVLVVTTEGQPCYRFQIEVMRLWVKNTQSISTILERKV